MKGCGFNFVFLLFLCNFCINHNSFWLMYIFIVVYKLTLWMQMLTINNYKNQGLLYLVSLVYSMYLEIFSNNFPI